MNDAVTYYKMQNISTANRLLGSETSNGTVREVQVNEHMIQDNAISKAKLGNVVDTTEGLEQNSDGSIKLKNQGVQGKHILEGTIELMHLCNNILTKLFLYK